MRRKLIKLSLIFIYIFILSISSGCTINNNKEIKEEIINFIETNVELLEKYIENEEYNKISTEFDLIELSHEKFEGDIELINYKYSNDMVLKSGLDFGIYYQNNNAPSSLPFKSDLELISDMDGWSVKYDGDWYYTERIRENWFYYKISY